MTRRALPSTTLGPAMRASLHAAHTHGCTPAELCTLHAIHIHTISWGKLTDRASLGQIAVTAGLWDDDPKDCPHWIRRRIARRLQALADAGAITYEPGGTDGWGASTIGLPGGADTDPAEGADTAPPAGANTAPPSGTRGSSPRGSQTRSPGGSQERSRGGARRGTKGEPSVLPSQGKTQGSNPVRGREALRSALRAALAPALRRTIGTDGGGGDSALDPYLDTALEHMTHDELAETLVDIADAGDLATLDQLWSAIDMCTDHPTPWATHLHDQAHARALRSNR